MSRLSREFFLRPTVRVSRDLLGKILCVRTPGGVERARIVETEAYLGVKDRAAHSFGGRRTERTAAMYLPGGHAYVYFIYGMHFCLNFTTRAAEVPEAVLIRAVEPLDEKAPPPRARMETNGPGKLCRHFGITRDDNGIDLTAPRARIWVEDAPRAKPSAIAETARIGIDGAGEAKDLPLRYFLKESPYVSGRKK